MPKHERIFALDSLRGFAAIMVCLFHFDIFNNGGTGVDLFFMISGFVIFMSLAQSPSIKSFWLSRVIRLYPVYWLSIAIAFLVGTLAVTYNLIPHNSPRFYLGNILMLQPIFKVDNLLGSYWTLYVELLFYAALSVIFFTKLYKYIEWLIVAAIIIVTGINIGYSYLLNSPGYVHFFIITRRLMPLITHFPVFAAGILFYVCYNNGVNVLRAFLLLTIIGAIAILHKYNIMINSYVTVNNHIIFVLIFYLAFLIIIARKDGLLKLKPFILLGNISYSFYLIHESCALVLNFYLEPVVGGFWAKTTAIVITLLLAYIITYYFDIPVQRWLKTKLRPKGKETVKI